MAVRLPVANTAEWDLWYRNNTLQKYLNLWVPSFVIHPFVIITLVSNLSSNSHLLCS
jgi:hypothetical protein